MYKNNRQVTLLTGMNGPGDQDLWMTGYLDGCCGARSAISAVIATRRWCR
jgi:hypothetical protein